MGNEAVRVMWGRKRKAPATAADGEASLPLKEAVHQARIEAAERTSVVVDLRDAEVARLELLNEALDPLFAEIPPEVELFDRGLSRGDTPRLWIDAVAHIAMGRDKRIYRLLQDTRVGRRVLAESHESPEMVQGGHRLRGAPAGRTRARARRGSRIHRPHRRGGRPTRERRRRRRRAFGALVFGFFLGLVALVLIVLLIAGRS